MRRTLTRAAAITGLVLAVLLFNTSAVAAAGTETWTINDRNSWCFVDELYDFGIQDVGVTCYDVFHSLRHHTETPTGYVGVEHTRIDMTVTYNGALVFEEQYVANRQVMWKDGIVQTNTNVRRGRVLACEYSYHMTAGQVLFERADCQQSNA
jgi:hypothetical protein